MFPVAIRKDHWIPLVHAIFPTHLIANHIYKRLLDHRAWRLTAPLEPSQLLITKKRRNQLSLNQVPTSIADLAHVTQNIDGKMIMNWDKLEQRDWARKWSRNIWHCPNGFNLKRGFRLEEYKFPQPTKREKSKWGWNGTNAPPKDLKAAVKKHNSIWQEMHAKRPGKVTDPLNSKEKKKSIPHRQLNSS
jgi:hypothetical protein